MSNMYSPTVTAQQSSTNSSASTTNNTSSSSNVAVSNQNTYSQPNEYYSAYPGAYSTNQAYHQFHQQLNPHLLHDQNNPSDLIYPNNLNGKWQNLFKSFTHIWLFCFKVFCHHIMNIGKRTKRLTMTNRFEFFSSIFIKLLKFMS